MECEKILANHRLDKGFLFRKCKELLQLNNKKTNMPVINWPSNMNRQFSKETYNGK